MTAPMTPDLLREKVALKPCPFCGPGNSIPGLWFDDTVQAHRVNCGSCGSGTGFKPRGTEEDAAEAWNRRAEPTPTERPDLAELRRLAEGATPGPWEWDEVMNPFYNDPGGRSCGGDGSGMAEFFQTDANGETLFDDHGEVSFVLPWKFNNAAYIAAANPATVLSLLDALTAAEARCDFIRKVQRDVVRAEIEQEGLVDDGWRDRALAAERDRDALQARLDEAERLLRRIDRKYADMQDGNGNHPTELRKVRTFLASKETNNG